MKAQPSFRERLIFDEYMWILRIRQQFPNKGLINHEQARISSSHLFHCHFILDPIFSKKEVYIHNLCHNGFSFDLDDHKNKWSRHRSFLYGCDRSPGTYVSKLGTEIPNQNDTTGLQNWIEILKSGNLVTCEEGLAPSQRPFENGTN